MRAIFTVIAFLFLVGVAETANAACSTQSIYDTRTGRMIVCTTCYDANGNPVSTICT